MNNARYRNIFSISLARHRSAPGIAKRWRGVRGRRAVRGGLCHAPARAVTPLRASAVPRRGAFDARRGRASASRDPEPLRRDRGRAGDWEVPSRLLRAGAHWLDAGARGAGPGRLERGRFLQGQDHILSPPVPAADSTGTGGSSRSTWRNTCRAPPSSSRTSPAPGMSSVRTRSTPQIFRSVHPSAACCD